MVSWQRDCTASSSGRQPNCGVEQRAPPMFGRATITLGIGPHYSWVLHFQGSTYTADYSRVFVSGGWTGLITNLRVPTIAMPPVNNDRRRAMRSKIRRWTAWIDMGRKVGWGCYRQDKTGRQRYDSIQRTVLRTVANKVGRSTDGGVWCLKFTLSHIWCNCMYRLRNSRQKQVTLLNERLLFRTYARSHTPLCYRHDYNTCSKVRLMKLII